MIYLALEYLRRSLDQYMKHHLDAGVDYVVLGEPGVLNGLNATEQQKFQNKVIINLLFSEEEAALKNSSPYFLGETAYDKINPPVYLNLNVVFCAYAKLYDTALIHLSLVAQFFQSHKLFEFSSNPVEESNEFALNSESRNNLNLTVEMTSPSTQEVNNIWGAIGSRVLPFLIYKVRVVQIFEREQLEEGRLIDTTVTKVQ